MNRRLCVFFLIATAVVASARAVDDSGRPSPAARATLAAMWAISESEGRVVARGEGGGARPRFRLAKGEEISPGETVLSGTGSRLELRGEGGALWRLGQHVVWQCREDGARLLAGSALVVVPDGATLRVATARATPELGAGVWLVTAVENGGLKITALENGRVALPARTDVKSGGAPANDGPKAAAEEKGDLLKLAAGEVVFAPPDGAAFGPIVTIYLEELMVTSRLISGFSEPLPQARRMLALAEAQRERIGAMTEAFVGGARAADRFEVVASKRRGPAPAQGDASAKPAPAQ